MELLGKCEAQYANNLLASKRVVLRTDRNRGDNPFIEFYLNETEKNVIIRIFNTVHIEDMKSNPEKYIVRHPGGMDEYYHKIDSLQEVIDSWEKVA